MITRLDLRNFKQIGDETFEFTDFDLLVGKNNSGKSTILQAMAIWQFCVEEFHRAQRKGNQGIQVVLPNFSALPVPEFNLLWKDRTDRKYPLQKGGKKRQEYIVIEINITWRSEGGDEQNFGVHLRYQSPQAIFAIPMVSWSEFKDLDSRNQLPVIAYVPPFSGLDPTEEWRDTSVIKKQVGKAQPGSVLRNLLLQVQDDENELNSWTEMSEAIEAWFSVKLKEPVYEKGVDTLIKCEYLQEKKSFDIIAGGSGFHQALTLLAFLYGLKPNTILMDEPDAHLHVNLQREILDFFAKQSTDKGIQFLIATHAEELVRGVNSSQIISLNNGAPSRNRPVASMLSAMAEVSNQLETELRQSPFLLYLEGESDNRMIRAWAQTLQHTASLDVFCIRYMGGGSKQKMKEDADAHFDAITEILPNVTRKVLFDFDDTKAFHPDSGNTRLFEWSRKNIENYLLIPSAWSRAVKKTLRIENDLFGSSVDDFILDFFASENLLLPNGGNWRSLSANVFEVVDGKSILFAKADSLNIRLKKEYPSLHLTPETVARHMLSNEIHDDIRSFFDFLEVL